MAQQNVMCPKLRAAGKPPFRGINPTCGSCGWISCFYSGNTACEIRGHGAPLESSKWWQQYQKSIEGLTEGEFWVYEMQDGNLFPLCLPSKNVGKRLCRLVEDAEELGIEIEDKVKAKYGAKAIIPSE